MKDDKQTFLKLLQNPKDWIENMLLMPKLGPNLFDFEDFGGPQAKNFVTFYNG